MKYCYLCKKSLSEDNFCKDKSEKDGLANSCRNCRQIIYQQRKMSGKLYQRFPKKICINCKQEYQPKRENSQYCSYHCFRSMKNKPCLTCGRIFYNSHFTRRFCSYKCYKESKIGKEDITAGGYVRTRVAEGTPGRGIDGRMPKHRYIMQQFLNRPLLPTEQIHHINGIRTDNKLENLELRSGPHGAGIKYQCEDCGSYNVHSVPLGERPINIISLQLSVQ